MVQAAKRRAIVRLTDGTLATLVSWGSAKHLHNRAGSGQRVRLEACDGETRRTAKKRDITEIVEYPK